jgi:hypothetical protein
MDFLVDVNVSGIVASWLAERGHNVAGKSSLLKPLLRK